MSEQIVIEPPNKHTCQPPEYRPKSEWRSMPPPPGWVAKKDRGTRFTLPTPYPPGTVWVCSCGRGWTAHRGRHYSKNPNFGWGRDFWMRVSWWQFRVKRRITARKAELAYEAAATVVDSFILTEAK